ncbi:flagellar hook-length control protein FliK [Vibrio sp. HA2012]|uniref:flagellar hook-length control protein FliK n=1 Tax=Vibrio sp. HA2012 TaxID=1971595 RepID=UPI000C2BC12F|nr:flagellar hook-length control protein FliK [Vibrio sp. HA2012]PJC86426.1 flagellar hook-length control protein FliK [Vibrio sp. HA2012]
MGMSIPNPSQQIKPAPILSADKEQIRPSFSSQDNTAGQETPAGFTLHLPEIIPFPEENLTRQTEQATDIHTKPEAEDNIDGPLLEFADISQPHQQEMSSFFRTGHLPNSVTTELVTHLHSESFKHQTSSTESSLDKLSFSSQLQEKPFLLTATSSEKPGDFLHSLKEVTSISAAISGSEIKNLSSMMQTVSLPTGTTAADKPAWANIQIDTTQGKWGEQMLQVLQDRVSLQANQKMQEAHIRLDPPELGKLELLVRVDGDKLNIQINANHAQVREALLQVSERLRSELQLQQFVHVDVNIGADTSGGSSSRQFNKESDESYRVTAAVTDTDSDTTTPANTSDHWLSTSA